MRKPDTNSDKKYIDKLLDKQGGFHISLAAKMMLLPNVRYLSSKSYRFYSLLFLFVVRESYKDDDPTPLWKRKIKNNGNYYLNKRSASILGIELNDNNAYPSIIKELTLFGLIKPSHTNSEGSYGKYSRHSYFFTINSYEEVKKVDADRALKIWNEAKSEQYEAKKSRMKKP